MKRISSEMNDHVFNGFAENTFCCDCGEAPVQFCWDRDVDAVVIHICTPDSLLVVPLRFRVDPVGTKQLPFANVYLKQCRALPAIPVNR